MLSTWSWDGAARRSAAVLAALRAWQPDRQARRKPIILTAVSVVALNVIVAFLVHSAFPALRFTNASDAPPPVVKARSASVVEVAQRTGKSPAEVVISRVLAKPPVLPAGALPVTGLQGVPSSPVDLVCGTRKGPGPVTAAGRGWTVANGSQLTSFRTGYTVTVSAFGAGQGAVALNALISQVNNTCANRSGTAQIVASTGAAGVDATTVSVNRSGGVTTAFLWRRGDVVAMVAAAGSSVPMGLVKEYDARLAAALVGVCANPDSTTSDAARSPYVNRAGFTGLTIAAPVNLPAGVTAPTPVAVPAAVNLPAVNLPPVPAAPYWPAELPAPVPAPVAPRVPVDPGSTTTAPARVQDDQGPGCGWSFTGQPVPAFDASTAATKADADAAAAADVLSAKVTSYEAELPDYQVAYTRYLAEVGSYQSYAQAVDTVAAAWEAIRVSQAQYQAAIVSYTAAVAARDAFLAQQAAATTTYDAAVAACGTATATPTPTDTPTDPFGDPLVDPPTSDPACPPVPAPIVSQPAPPPPPSPAPPPDPRPTP